MSLADPHCHTLASDGMVSPAELVAAAAARHLDLIAVTDHDTMQAAGEVRERGQAAGLEVVMGMEVTTRWPALTHVLGWYLERPVRSGMSLLDTVDAIHEQGGLAVIPHPFMPTWFASCQPGTLARLIQQRALDGIEIEFSAPIPARRKRVLLRFYRANQERLGAALGSSDSHFGAHDLGRCATRYEGDFQAAVRERRTEPVRSGRRRVPAALVARQQVKSLLELPLRRLTRRL